MDRRIIDAWNATKATMRIETPEESHAGPGLATDEQHVSGWRLVTLSNGRTEWQETAKGYKFYPETNAWHAGQMIPVDDLYSQADYRSSSSGQVLDKVADVAREHFVTH